MGHNRPVRAAHRSVPCARCRAFGATQRDACQPDIRLYAIPLVLYIRNRFTLVLPQLTGKGMKGA